MMDWLKTDLSNLQPSTINTNVGRPPKYNKRKQPNEREISPEKRIFITRLAGAKNIGHNRRSCPSKVKYYNCKL